MGCQGQGAGLFPDSTLQAVWRARQVAQGCPEVLTAPPLLDSGPSPRHSASSLPALPGPACVHGGKTYSHGEVWHPAFRSFGPLPCILCTCQDGRQDCQRVTCPTEYPCHRPEKVAGKCCKICPGTRNAWGREGAGGVSPGSLSPGRRHLGHVSQGRGTDSEGFTG